MCLHIFTSKTNAKATKKHCLSHVQITRHGSKREPKQSLANILTTHSYATYHTYIRKLTHVCVRVHAYASVKCALVDKCAKKSKWQMLVAALKVRCCCWQREPDEEGRRGHDDDDEHHLCPPITFFTNDFVCFAACHLIRHYFFLLVLFLTFLFARIWFSAQRFLTFVAKFFFVVWCECVCIPLFVLCDCWCCCPFELLANHCTSDKLR